MKLTILGTSAAYPGPDSPCSGYLLQDKSKNILIDCGTGTLGNLLRFLSLDQITDIVISHMHADHFLDLIPFRYALRYGTNLARPFRPALHLPPEGINILNRVVAPFAESDDFFSGVFEVTEFDPARPLMIGNLSVSSILVRHYIPSYALAFSSTRKFAYSSDSGFCPQLGEIARGADLFLSTVGRCLGPGIEHLWGHLLPEEAGRIAKDSGVKQLLITHMWPECDPVTACQEASKSFGREVQFAEVLRTYEV